MAEDIKSVVVARADDGVRSTYAQTGGIDTPNLIVRALSPLRMVVTRVARVYLQSVTGIVTAGATGLDKVSVAGVQIDMLPNDFWELFLLACKMSVAIGGITLLQNVTELAVKLDQKYPELRA